MAMAMAMVVVCFEGVDLIVFEIVATFHDLDLMLSLSLLFLSLAFYNERERESEEIEWVLMDMREEGEDDARLRIIVVCCWLACFKCCVLCK